VPDLSGTSRTIDILLTVHPEASLFWPPEVLERDNYLGFLTLGISHPEPEELDALGHPFRPHSAFHVELGADCSGDFPVWFRYSFHYIGPRRLGFRFDNSPHHRELANFPHHLHLSTGEILPLGPPAIRDVAAIVRWHIDHPGTHWRP
jgi:hypothetical protein